MTIDGYGVTNSVNKATTTPSSKFDLDSISEPTSASVPADSSNASTTDSSKNGNYIDLQYDYCMNNAFMQVESQREHKTDEENEENKWMKLNYTDEDEEEENEKIDMIDYLIKELKNADKDLLLEGNAQMDRWKFLKENFGNLFSLAN